MSNYTLWELQIYSRIQGQENMKPAAGTSLDIRRARLVIGRVGERDAMTLKCEVGFSTASARNRRKDEYQQSEISRK